MMMVKRMLNAAVDVLFVLLLVNAMVVLASWLMRWVFGGPHSFGVGGGLFALYTLAVGMFVWLLPLMVIFALALAFVPVVADHSHRA